MFPNSLMKEKEKLVHFIAYNYSVEVYFETYSLGKLPTG